MVEQALCHASHICLDEIVNYPFDVFLRLLFILNDLYYVCDVLLATEPAGYMAHMVDALNFKLQSKICYHRDANVDYLEIKAMVDKLIEENKKFQDEKVEYLDMINTVIEEKENLANDYQGYMAHRVDALIFKLQSKICYHRDANVDYLEIKAMVDKLLEENTKFRDEKVEYLDMINTVIEEKENLANDYQVIKEQVAPMEEQLETVQKELAAAKHELVAAKQQLVAEKHEHVAANHENVVSKEELAVAKEELVVAKQKLAQKNEELEILRKKVLESETMHAQLQQQKGSAPGPEPVHSRRVTRSTHKREMLLQGLLVNDADRNRLKKRKSYTQRQNNPIVVQSASPGNDLDVVRQMLIKGFTEIDAGWYIGIKEMGKLNEKPFLDACAMKLPPSQSGAKASELYTLWQELLNNPEWKTFKTVTVDGNRQEEVIDADDEKLRLKMSWGEGPYNSVIGALTERKENNTDGTESTVDFWNYKEGSKATIEECIDHIFDQLKELKKLRPRKYRHLADFSVEAK